MPQHEGLSTPFSLNGEVAIVTGGGSGLGLGIARCFVASGAKILLVGRREQKLQEASAELGSRAIPCPLDITNASAVEQTLDGIRREHGSPSILVNNAGIHLKKAAIDTSPQEFQDMLGTHVVAAHHLSSLVLPDMLERKHGSILFIASVTSFIGVPNVIAYSAAKNAYSGMVRSLALENSDRGVRINAIAPGWIESPMLNCALNGDTQRRERILARTPMNCFGKPEDIGWTAVFLCSDAAKFITGSVIPVDGGASIGF